MASAFNPADHDSNITLSNGNLTATCTGTATNTFGARGDTSRGTGKWVWAFTPTVLGSGQSNDQNGFASSSQNLNNSSFSSSGFSIHCRNNGGTNKLEVRYNGTTPLTFASTSQAVGVKNYHAIDYDQSAGTGKYWVKVGSGNWNDSATANPDTGAGGISFSIAGPMFPVYGGTVPNDAGTYDGMASGHGLTNFTPWDGVVAAAGSAAATGSATAVGTATKAATGSAAGVGSASAVGAATKAAAGSAAGVGSASGASPAASSSAAGSAAGTGAASGVGRAVNAAIGTATGSSTASGVGQATKAAAGTATGTGSASAAGVALAASIGTAAGTSAANGTGRSTAASVGAAAGVGFASGQAPVVVVIASGAGRATGVGSASSISADTSAEIIPFSRWVTALAEDRGVSAQTEDRTVASLVEDRSILANSELRRVAGRN